MVGTNASRRPARRRSARMAWRNPCGMSWRQTPPPRSISSPRAGLVSWWGRRSVQSTQVGTYTLTPTDSGTHIRLDLEIGVKVPMPGFILKRVLKGALDTGSKGFKKYVESR